MFTFETPLLKSRMANLVVGCAVFCCLLVLGVLWSWQAWDGGAIVLALLTCALLCARLRSSPRLTGLRLTRTGELYAILNHPDSSPSTWLPIQPQRIVFAGPFGILLQGSLYMPNTIQKTVSVMIWADTVAPTVLLKLRIWSRWLRRAH